MRKDVIGIVAMLTCMAMGTVGAVSQTIEMGPYDVSFDMGYDEAIEVEETQTVNLTDLSGDLNSIRHYAVSLVDDNIVGIYIGTEITPDMMRVYTPKNVVLSMFDTIQGVDIDESRSREIDSHNGFIGSGRHRYSTTTMTIAAYTIENDTICVATTVPWNGGASELVATIHTEKVRGSPPEEA